jgi:hypothetical protein
MAIDLWRFYYYVSPHLYRELSDDDRQHLQAEWARRRATHGQWPRRFTCRSCGAAFYYPTWWELSVCSAACKQAWATTRRRATRQRTAPRLHPYERVCEQCGQRISATRRDATTCSGRCRIARLRAVRGPHDRAAAG